MAGLVQALALSTCAGHCLPSCWGSGFNLSHCDLTDLRPSCLEAVPGTAALLCSKLCKQCTPLQPHRDCNSTCQWGLRLCKYVSAWLSLNLSHNGILGIYPLACVQYSTLAAGTRFQRAVQREASRARREAHAGG